MTRRARQTSHTQQRTNELDGGTEHGFGMGHIVDHRLGERRLQLRYQLLQAVEHLM